MHIVVGFLAGVLAVLLVHQPMIWALATAKIIPAVAYNMEPLKNAPAVLAVTFTSFGLNGWPTLFNLMFWGGLWGALYGLAFVRLPLASWLKGLLLGLCVVIAGNWLLVPLAKGSALFGGLDPFRMAITSVINIPFGIATGVIYGLLRPSN